MRSFVAIVLSIVALTAAYGIIHDQITARISLEYFTVGHPPLVNSTDPTVLALVWGVVATWWFALPFAVVAAAVARVGQNPLPIAFTLRAAAFSLVATGVCAIVAGVTAALQHPLIPTHWAERIPADRQYSFMIAAWTHLASYFAGGAFALASIAFLGWKRANSGDRV